MNRTQRRTVEVHVATDGSLAIEAVAFRGSDCEQATRFLEEALGVIGTKTRKPEYHQQTRRHTQQHT